MSYLPVLHILQTFLYTCETVRIEFDWQWCKFSSAKNRCDQRSSPCTKSLIFITRIVDFGEFVWLIIGLVSR